MKRKMLFGVLAVLLALGALGVALAHAKVDHCTPEAGSTVSAAPTEVVCVMTEEIDTKLSTMAVTDASGAQVDKKDAHVDLDDPDRKTLVASLDSAMVKDGIYTVKWHVVTPDDEGVSDGTFQFIVGSAQVTPQPTTEVEQADETGTPAATGTITSSETVSPTVEITTTATGTVSPTLEMTATATVTATVAAGTETPTPAATGEAASAAAKYCTDQGGKVVERYPTYNTNAPQSEWLGLSNPRDFCTFFSEPDSTGFQSQIAIDLDTLYSDQPTLAVLAYLEPVALPPFTGANPSTLYCQKLGGSDIWGGMNNTAGGGWVTDEPDSATNFQVVSMCVFPDMSSIDSWGLTYKASGVIRGTDLSKVVHYQPAQLPPVFVSGTSSNEPAVGTVDKVLTKADNGSTVTLKVGDVLQVQLESNPSTGFSWQVNPEDKAVLAPLGASTFDLGPGKTPIPGGGGTETFTFNAVSEGQTTLTLVYIRPWETNVTPTAPNTFSVTVKVE